MNSNLFRVIFNRTLQRFVVTSELAKSEGKSRLTSGVLSPSILQMSARLRPLVFSLFCVLGFVSISDPAFANLIIQADKSAPKSQQPIILQTANGLPQINIQTPNAQGLSHSKYTKFDVDKGAILNNSRTNAKTQQAGWVQGNPYLARGEAKIILNEVNSAAPSVLKGYVEVAGKKADVIIANPSGIHCEGCGVINSDRTTLTTGKPQIQQGNLESFVVEKGKVKVSGKGLDNSRVDYTEIIARETKVNAGIWSKKETKVVTGKNTVKRSENPQALQILHTQQPLATENQPQFAIDVGQLGGMYAGKIHLIGTEHGVGVRNAGHIGASAETLQIDSQGRIVNTSTLNANNVLTLTAQQGVENRGKIENRQGDIRLTSNAEIQQDGSVVARGGNIHKTANRTIHQQGETVAKGNVRYQAPQIDANQHALIAAGVDIEDSVQGEVRQLNRALSSNIEITASQEATLQGRHIAPQQVQVQSPSLNLNQSRTNARHIQFTATLGNLDANNAGLFATEHLVLSTPTTLSTQQSYLKADKITTTQRSLIAKGGLWEQTGKSPFSLQVEGTLNNQGGTFATQGDFKLNAVGIDNKQGRLIAGQNLHINTSQQTLDSTEGQISAGQHLVINTGKLFNDKGLIQSSQQFTLNADTLQNHHGRIVAGSEATLYINHSLSQKNGQIGAKNLRLSTNELHSTQHSVITADSASLTMKGKADNHQSVIHTTNDLTLKSQALNNDQGQLSSQQGAIHLTTQNKLSNQQGNLLAAQNVHIKSNQLENKQGVILSETGTITLNTSHQLFNNMQGKVHAKIGIDLQSGELNNHQGMIQSEGDIHINTHQHRLTNSDTLAENSGIVALGRLSIQSDELINQQGYLASQKPLSLTATKIDNTAGLIKTGSSLSVSANTWLNHQGIALASDVSHIQLKNDLSQKSGQIGADKLILQANTLNSRDGSIISAQNIALTLGSHLINRHSKIFAQQDFLSTSQSIDNTEGTLSTQKGDLSLNSQNKIENQAGKISAGNDLRLTSDELNNSQGLIQSQRHMRLDTQQGHLINHQTQSQTTPQGIIALGDMQLHTQQLNNQQGTILSNGDQKIEANQLLNPHGILSSFATQAVNVAEQINNQNGRINGKQSNVNASLLDNQKGIIQGSDRLQLTVQKSINNHLGNIQSANYTQIYSQQLNNTQGNIRSIEGDVALTVEEVLDNPQGNIIAKNGIKVTAHGVNNPKGLLYSEQGTLAVEAKNQHIDNQQGEITAKHRLELNAGKIINLNGHIFATHYGKLTASHTLDNRQSGNITGLGEWEIQTSTLYNQKGEIRSLGHLTLNAKERIYNDADGYSGSRIESGGTLRLTAPYISNQQTIGTNDQQIQGLISRQLYLTANTVLNQQGGIYSRDNAKLDITSQFDNQQGEVLSTGNVSITGSPLDINNQHGRLQANHHLTVQSRSLSSDGHLEAEHLRLQLHNDFATSRHINANRTLSINTEGHLINSHHLYADDAVTLQANHITNNATGRISSALTQITAKGTLTNEGLINSIGIDDNAKTRINANQIINIGQGRIYGDHIALQAETILNQDKNETTESGTHSYSPVIAARQRFDIAAQEINNETNYYHNPNQIGSTLFSLGEIYFGRQLDDNDHAIGQAEILRNYSSIIEADGNIALNISQIDNKNIHFKAEHVINGKPVNDITKVTEYAQNKSYIVPMGRHQRGNLQTFFANDINGDKSTINKKDPHIPMSHLKWAGWSRAGQLVYKTDGVTPTELKAGDQITPDIVLATRNDATCDDNGKNCRYTPAGQYGLDSPIWQYANTEAPKEVAPQFPFDELEAQSWYKVEEWFTKNPETEEYDDFKAPKSPKKAPIKPQKNEGQSQEDYQQALNRYEVALAAYQTEKAKWDFYQEKIQPYNDWAEKYKTNLEAVDNAIEKHNRARLSTLKLPYYRSFWKIDLTQHREDSSKVLATLPSQILAGGQLSADSSSFINNRSTVISGREMHLTSNIENLDEKGLHRITDTGKKVYTFDKWRGGFKRYFQRRWENKGDYVRLIETPFDMQIYKMESNVGEVKKTTPTVHSQQTAHNLALSEVTLGENVFNEANSHTFGSLLKHSAVSLTPEPNPNGSLSGNALLHHSQDVALGKVATPPNRAMVSTGKKTTDASASYPTRQISTIHLDNGQEIRSITPNVHINNSMLYRINAHPTNQIVIETDPDFTHNKRWLGSDYMLNALRYEPNAAQKRLGDGFYEQRLVKEQINRLTGRHYLGNYTDFNRQYQDLMNAGITFAQRFHLRPGVALSPQIVAQLTSDIVWLENENIQFPDGSRQSVLVPKVYAIAKKAILLVTAHCFPQIPFITKRANLSIKARWQGVSSSNWRVSNSTTPEKSAGEFYKVISQVMLKISVAQ